MPSTGQLRRRISPLITSLLDQEPVVAIHGPRSVGKSAVLHTIAARRGVPVIDLDTSTVRAAAIDDPDSIVSGARPVCIDEYQHAPALLDALKARLNSEGSQPGLAVLTGSTRQDTLPRASQSLTGRLHSLTLWPLSQGEMAGVTEDLVVALRLDPEAAVRHHPTSSTGRADYAERICTGGFPLALGRSHAARHRWFDNYVRQSVERDAIELTRIKQRQALAQLLLRSASQTAQILNVTNTAEGLDLPRRTAEDYFRLLEDLFLVSRLPAWGKSLRSRATARPKVHFVDSGVAAHLMRITVSKLATWDPTTQTEFGNLLETFVVGELRKHLSWMDEPHHAGHWRTSDGFEVHFVIEFFDGTVIAFEVKASTSAQARDFAGLASLRATLGSAFRAGVLLNTGTRSYTHDDRLHVMPVDRLWQTVHLDGAPSTETTAEADSDNE